jgi:hypothetical protein
MIRQQHTVIAWAAAGATLVLLLAFVPQIEQRLLKLFPQYRLVLEHLPGRQFDSGDPVYQHFDEPVPLRLDNDALRRAASLLPDDATYAVVAGGDDRAFSEIAKGAGLFFSPALRVTAIGRASWVLTYRSPVPPKIPVDRRYSVGGGFSLVRLQR